MTPLSRQAYATATKHADAQYKGDKAKYASPSGNAKDICTAEPKGNASVAGALRTASTPLARVLGC